MKIVIGIPTNGSATKPFLDAIASLMPPSEDMLLEPIIVTGNFVPGQRELLVQKAAEVGADLLVMIDDDVVPPSDMLLRLAETMRGDETLAIAGALYYSRDGIRPMAVTNWHSADTTDSFVPAFSYDEPTIVDGVGFGCVAVRMSAINELDLPIFATQVAINAEENAVIICNEDYLLCERFRHAGMRVALDARVRCAHYDRRSAQHLPLDWESASEIMRPRIPVREADGMMRLAPLDNSIPRVHERHLATTLDYLYL